METYIHTYIIYIYISISSHAIMKGSLVLPSYGRMMTNVHGESCRRVNQRGSNSNLQVGIIHYVTVISVRLRG